MVNHTFHVLDFHKLLHILSRYASSTLGQADCLSLNPATDRNTIENEQRLVSEMKLLLGVKGFFVLEGLTDIDAILKRCRVEGSCLDPEDILSVLRIAEATKASLKAIQSQQDLWPGLYNLVKDIPLFDDLTGIIKKTIHPNGTINDSATHELKNIRKSKRDLRRNLQKRLEDIQKSLGAGSEEHDNPISIRDGRYVIPLRTDKKTKIKGIVHDYSHTRATCFFEPMAVVEDNNRLAELSHLEKEEVFKILTKLTGRVRDSAELLHIAQARLSKLDGLLARARFSTALNGIEPIITQKGLVDLRQAMNPILMSMEPGGGSTVPVDIMMDRDMNVLIISGPNRGGKTVTLKTLGLLCLMAQSGLHIPVSEGTQLPVFQQIFAEIGDEQDMQVGLSTFSAHISHLKFIMDQADADSLIIIDEPGMGTDPDEGAALAMTLLDDLSQKGASVAVSTHYNRLKTYGLLGKRTKNASMEFDEITNHPTFILKYGTPGTSYAFEIAKEYGINPEFIERAKRYLDEDEIRLNRLIDKLNRLTHETAIEKAAAEHNKRKYHSAKERLEKVMRQSEADRDSFIKEKGAEADQVITEAREELKRIINAFKKKTVGRKDFVRQFDEIADKVMDHFQRDAEKDRTVASHEIQLGQWVKHKHLGHSGRIISLDTDNAKAKIMSGSVTLSVDVTDLEIVSDLEKPETCESSGVSHPIRGRLSREINLIGYRVADALPLIDKMIDKTMMEGDLSLRIIHGHGTGRLKSAIRDHLRNFSCVKRIGGADPQSGGDAITIVELA